MTRKRMGRGAAVMAGLGLLLAACQPAVQPASPSSAAPEPEYVEAKASLGPGDFDMPDMRGGLDALASYTATLVVTFDGSQDGTPLQWTAKYVMVKTTDPQGRALSTEQSENIREDDPVFLAELGGVQYRVNSGEACNGTNAADSQYPIAELEPAGMLAGVLGAESAGSESVNGVDAARYTFDQRAIGQNGSNESSGEVWVAAAGGHALRYRLTTTGGEAFFGKGQQGTLTREYELTDINQPLSIPLPADCPPGLVDIPRLADAANVQDEPGFLTYESSTSVEEAAAFYEKELPALGWVAPEAEAALPPGVSAEEYAQALEAMQALGLSQPAGPPPTPNPDQTFLEFERGEQKLIVIITREAAGTEVAVNLRGKE